MVKALELPELLSSDEIKLEQDSIRKSLTALDQMVHHNAVQCLMHCAEHRDTSLMVRLLIDIIDQDKTGYRRQGLIAWMKYFTPMRLSGKTVNMSGKVEKDGKMVEQPFNLEEAWKTPFWLLTREPSEELRPFYQQAFMAQVNRAIKAFEDAMGNTVNGQPIDKTKPYFKGKNADTITAFATEIKKLAAVVPPDATQEVDKAKAKQAELANAA